jgi:hypothetical protein
VIIRERKKKFVDFEGEKILKRRHDDVKIIIRK